MRTVLDFTSIARGSIGESRVHSASVDDFAILQQFPRQVELVQVIKAAFVEDADIAIRKVIVCRLVEPELLILILDLSQLRLRVAVRRHEAVHAEVAAADAVTAVAAKAVEIAAHVIINAMMRVILTIVVIIEAAGARLGVLQRRHIVPDQDAGVRVRDRGTAASLTVDLRLVQRPGVDAGQRNLAGEADALIGLIADGKLIAQIVIDRDTANILCADLHAVEIGRQVRTIIGADDLMPPADPVFTRQVNRQRSPALRLTLLENEELQVPVLRLHADLPVALRDQHLRAVQRCGLADDLERELLAAAGECFVDLTVRIREDVAAVHNARAGQTGIARVLIQLVIARHRGIVLRVVMRVDIAAFPCADLQLPALVDPVPDEAAEHVGAAADGVPVFLERADRVAHGMVVFAEHVRHLGVRRRCPALRTGLAVIHVAAHVRTVRRAAGFAVDRARGVMVLEIPDRVIEHAFRIVLVAGIITFVAGRPADVRCDVLQTLERCRRAVKHHLLEEGLLRLPCLILHLVGFLVRLGHYIQAVFVAEIVKIIVVRVMRGTDGVDIVLLHQLNIRRVYLVRDIFAVYRIGVVAVCPTEDQRLTVDRHRLIALVEICRAIAVFIHFTAREPDLAEAELLRHGTVVRALRIAERQHQRVQVRIFVRPQVWRGDLPVGHAARAGGAGNVALLRCSVFCRNAADRNGLGADLLLIGVEQLRHDLPAVLRRAGVVADVDVQLDCCVGIVVRQMCFDLIVLQMDSRSCVQIDVAEDAAVLVHILKLEPRAVAELVDLHGQQVFTIDQIVRHVEAVRAVCILGVADGLTVQIDVVRRFHALEVQVDAAVGALQALADREALAIQADRGGFFGNLRCKVVSSVAGLPRHVGIGVDRIIEAVILPAGRQRQPRLPFAVAARLVGSQIRALHIIRLVEVLVACVSTVLCTCKDGQFPVLVGGIFA